MNNISLAKELYDSGLDCLKKYCPELANHYFSVAYDLLPEDAMVEWKSDLCWRLALRLPHWDTQRRIKLLETALDGFTKQKQSGKDISDKFLKEISFSLKREKFYREEQKNHGTLSPAAESRVLGLEKINAYFDYDYVRETAFHDAEIVELTYTYGKAILRLNLDGICVATLAFENCIEIAAPSLDSLYLSEMNFRMSHPEWLECNLDGVGVTLMCSKVTVEKVEPISVND